jgi:endoglucanase
VPLGTLGTVAVPFESEQGVLRGKALDDRLGVATLVHLLARTYEGVDLFGVFTTQEEIGLRGAGPAAYRLAPDLAIVLDCTPARDIPLAGGEENPFYNTRLGEGPALYSIDASTVSDPALFRLAEAIAGQQGIRVQLRQPGGGSTDAGAIHRTLGGVPSLSISVPGRNLHGAVSTAVLTDWRGQARLVEGMLAQLSPATFPKAASR